MTPISCETRKNLRWWIDASGERSQPPTSGDDKECLPVAVITVGGRRV